MYPMAWLHGTTPHSLRPSTAWVVPCNQAIGYIQSYHVPAPHTTEVAPRRSLLSLSAVSPKRSTSARCETKRLILLKILFLHFIAVFSQQSKHFGERRPVVYSRLFSTSRPFWDGLAALGTCRPRLKPPLKRWHILSTTSPNYPGAIMFNIFHYGLPSIM